MQLRTSVCSRAGGGKRRLSARSVLQAEDFSAYGKVCPSLYMFLGVGEVPPLHSPYFDFDESVLEKGLETFLRLFFS